MLGRSGVAFCALEGMANTESDNRESDAFFIWHFIVLLFRDKCTQKN